MAREKVPDDGLTFHERALLRRLSPECRLARESSHTDEGTMGGGICLSPRTIWTACSAKIRAVPYPEGQGNSVRRRAVRRRQRTTVRACKCLSLTISLRVSARFSPLAGSLARSSASCG